MASRVIQAETWKPIQLAIEFENDFQLNLFLSMTALPTAAMLELVRAVEYSSVQHLANEQIEDAYNQLVSYECYNTLKTISAAATLLEEIDWTSTRGQVTSVDYEVDRKPIGVVLNFATPEQLAVWLALTSSSTDTAEVICKHAYHDYVYRVEQAVSSMCSVNDWCVLNKHLKRYA